MSFARSLSIKATRCLRLPLLAYALPSRLHYSLLEQATTTHLRAPSPHLHLRFVGRSTSRRFASMAMPSTLPEIPVKHASFIEHVSAHPDTPLPELLEPYKQYDAKLREVFAQEPHHPALADPHLNVLPVFDGKEKDVKIRARDLGSESAEEKERYVMPLDEKDRRPTGSPAIVQNIKEFQQNFAVFCESSLVDLDWSNVVAAGSSVVTCLLPVPDKHKKSKRALRRYYHEMIAPASDVDLFLYGLSEEDATKKIIEIEQRVKDSILTETTTIRTKNAITIASQYPTRHIQIVLRIYKSVSEILTGFDVDCSCAAYDGRQVWAAPRALIAYMTQTNTIDLTRRSPSYESRLSKYSHRGFEVYWPLLDRSRVDPTIFERNFARTVGLARLLVLERLPSKNEREAYMDERRRERGRPEINRFHRYSRQDNIKEKYEDEVAEWVSQEEVSDYHTFTIPYGPKYHAKKIEKLLYTKDLLLNAEWNVKDREVNLHRHPAFFGYAEDIIHDCCGFCPKPVTPEEHDIAEEEAKIYVSGEICFVKDDPGRQAIGSFNPITDDDWTEMAYVGNTARLCEAIVDQDADHVEDWLSQEGSDPNCRDYTGRTPLHLAVMSSSSKIVRILIDHGARLVARLADGRTALHLAAARGNVEMVKMILDKSEANEEEEAKREDIRKQARMAAREGKGEASIHDTKPTASNEDSDLEMVEQGEDESDEDDEGIRSTTTGSFVKVRDADKKVEEFMPEEEEDEPDVYDVNVLAWDTKCSPLHLAILGGHIDVVKELVQNHGADILLPIKLLNDYDKSARGAILTLVLALNLPLEEAKAMTKTLLQLGASSAQADTKQTTALHYISTAKPEILETLVEFDEPAVKRAINHLAVAGSMWSPSASSPLMSAISKKNTLAALKLLDAGAATNIDFKDWLKSVEAQYDSVHTHNSEQNKRNFERDVEQPIILAVQNELPEVVAQLLERGADPNTLTKDTKQNLANTCEKLLFPRRLYKLIQYAIYVLFFIMKIANYFLRIDYRQNSPMYTLLDLVREKIKSLKNYEGEDAPSMPYIMLKEGVNYLSKFDEGSYQWFAAKGQVDAARSQDKRNMDNYEKQLKEYDECEGVEEKKDALETLRKQFIPLEKSLLDKGAKTFRELHPDTIDSQVRGHDLLSYTPPPPKPFEIKFDFRTHDMTDENREGYLKLFQAAWDGDLDTIKSLTLAPWGISNNTPLRITVQDMDSYSPFHLAVLRGHLDVARAIVEISFAQYQLPDEEQPKTYRIGDEDEGDVNASNEVIVYSEIVDDKFTIENIGEVATQVKSTTSPLAYISWAFPVWKYVQCFLPDKKFTCGMDNREIDELNSPFSLQSWAIVANDKTLFSFLLDLDVEWTDRLAITLDSSSGIPSFAEADFELAIRYGRVDLLAEMIKHGGAGMELSSLVKKSGVKYHEKPKYYQGLSVHGKKRSDWVSAARGTFNRSVADSKPPLLRAAFEGSLQSVEWFLSDTPSRHYLDFAEAYKDDKLISHLNRNAGGFEKVLRTWLDARHELVLHCAVMAKPRPETSKLIQYLIQAVPGSLEAKSVDGYTPLALAFSLHRLDAAKILIDAGANQTARDNSGNNIIHFLLSPVNSGLYGQYKAANDEKTIQPLLDLIDKRLIPYLLTERSSRRPGSLTPIASWLRSSNTENANFLRALLDFAEPTGNEHLELLDASGDTPLHYVVKARKQSWLKTILERRPDLLYNENSVGRTPYELAEDAYIAERVQTIPAGSNGVFSHRYHYAQNLLADFPSRTFAPGYKEPESINKESIWRVCDEFVKKHPGRRKLVSLLDANEVAKRLATRNKAAPVTKGDEGSEAGSDVEENDGNYDEVNLWYGSAPANPETADNAQSMDGYGQAYQLGYDYSV